MISSIVFYGFSAALVTSAVLVVCHRNIFTAAMYLAMALSLVSGLFVLLGADFLAAVQLLLYVGGVIVVIAFAVMLTSVGKDRLEPQVNAQWVPALLAAGGLLVLLLAVFLKQPFAGHPAPHLPTSEALGGLLLRDLVLPFEAVSLILTAALLGAVFFSGKNESSGARR
jgi:NADH-quinone oxidoreductase subunit J